MLSSSGNGGGDFSPCLAAHFIVILIIMMTVMMMMMMMKIKKIMMMMTNSRMNMSLPAELTILASAHGKYPFAINSLGSFNPGSLLCHYLVKEHSRWKKA